MTPSQAPVSEQDLDDFIEGFYPSSTSYRMAAELKHTRALLRDSREAIECGAQELQIRGDFCEMHGEKRAWHERAATLRKLIEACP